MSLKNSLPYAFSDFISYFKLLRGFIGVGLSEAVRVKATKQQILF